MAVYDVCRALYEDLPEIEQIYSYARTYMKEHGNPTQWGTTNPSREKLLEDIRKAQLYKIVAHEHICGVFAFVLGEDATYACIDGAWSSNESYGTIHRLAGNGAGGIFNTCLDFCRHRCSYIRIDTHENNLIMQHLIGKAGFRQCGIIHIEDGSPRIAYDLKRA